MIYYKAFQHGCEEGRYQSKHDLLKVQYTVGQTYTIAGNEPPILCKRGYHACAIPLNCFEETYGYNYDNDVLGVVELSARCDTDGEKTVGSSMKIIRILTREETNTLCSGVRLRNGSFIYAHDVDGIASIPAYMKQYWYSSGRLHRDGDKPAIISDTGSTRWYCNGKLHRDGDKPAIIHIRGGMEWFVNGKLHREADKPAIICYNGSMQWFCNDRSHRDGDKPANIIEYLLEWFVHGKLQRDGDKPARLYVVGYAEWYWNGLLHRDNDKPAILDPAGNMEWYYNGKLHRKGHKPSIITRTGNMDWHRDGKLQRSTGNSECTRHYAVAL
jgi:hypothetical protein